jgi:hypothetical protein
MNMRQIAALLLVGSLEITACYAWMVPTACFLRKQESIPMFSKSPHSSLNRICMERPLFASSANSALFRRNGGVCLGASEQDEFVEAEDLEALQTLFSKYCDSEGLMTKVVVMQIPAIAELMVRVVFLPRVHAQQLLYLQGLVCDDKKCSRITPRYNAG